MSEAEDRLDQVFINAFETNHPAMLDWVSVKFELQSARKNGATAICTGCVMEHCDKAQSSRCKTCHRFYQDNYLPPTRLPCGPSRIGERSND